jgi:hypothetical protein
MATPSKARVAEALRKVIAGIAENLTGRVDLGCPERRAPPPHEGRRDPTGPEEAFRLELGRSP